MKIRVLTVHPALPAGTRCADEIDIDDGLAASLVGNGDAEAVAPVIEAGSIVHSERPKGRSRKGA